MNNHEVYIDLIGRLKARMRNTVVASGVAYIDGVLVKSLKHYNVVYTDPLTRVQYWYNRHQKLVHVVRLM